MEIINWKAVAEELMERLKHHTGGSLFWLDNLPNRDFLARQLKEMFERFLIDTQSVESPITDEKDWYRKL